jgi:hypothetical protein
MAFERSLFWLTVRFLPNFDLCKKEFSWKKIDQNSPDFFEEAKKFKSSEFYDNF